MVDCFVKEGVEEGVAQVGGGCVGAGGDEVFSSFSVCLGSAASSSIIGASSSFANPCVDGTVDSRVRTAADYCMTASPAGPRPPSSQPVSLPPPPAGWQNHAAH